MTTIDHADHAPSLGDRWRLLVAVLLYAAAVSAYVTLSTSVSARELGISGANPGSAQDIFFIVIGFGSIIAYAVGFMLLAVLLDAWTGRSPQPLAALNLPVPAIATFDLIRTPLLVIAFQIWFWLTTTA